MFYGEVVSLRGSKSDIEGNQEGKEGKEGGEGVAPTAKREAGR